MENTVEHQNGSDNEDVDPMEVFNQQFEDIVKTYGIAATLMQEQISNLEKQEEQDGKQEGPGGNQDAAAPGSASGNGMAHLMKCLEKVKSPEQKVKIVLEKYAVLLKQNSLLQKQSQSMKMQKDSLHLELSQALLARTKVEELCKDLQGYNKTMRGEFLQKCGDEESKRKEVTAHFQTTLVDIQAQIDEYSVRNLKLCKENADLAEKLNNIIEQYEKREESLEKIFKHHDVQQKLAEAKLEQANILMKEAEVNHKKEKEYLLKEAIDKTKKCYALKEQELSMKKQLVLYSQKFEEFQATLGKSNDIYVTFREEMDKMSKKMKKLEKESDFWRQRFESCNKSLMDVINERTEKAKEFEIFVIKVDKLETLCRALQHERKGLYDKIKSIRFDMFHADTPQAITLKEEEVPAGGLESIGALGVTTEMEKLKAEQMRLQELAASIAAAVAKRDQRGGSDEEEEEKEEDSAADNSDKTPPAPEPVQEAQKSEPCEAESAEEQIKQDRAETQVLEQPEVADIAEGVKTEPEVLPAQLVSSSEAKTEGQVQDHVKAEAVVPRETAAVVTSSNEGNANQQQQENTSVQVSPAAPPPVGVESTKAEVSESKAEEKPQPAPQEKPAAEGPAKAEVASEEKPQPAPQEKPAAEGPAKAEVASEEKPQHAPQEKPAAEGPAKAEVASEEKPQHAPQEKPAAEGPAKAKVASPAKPQATNAKPQTPNAEPEASNTKPKGKKGKKKAKK